MAIYKKCKDGRPSRAGQAESNSSGCCKLESVCCSRVTAGRIVFLLCLVCVAIVLGYAANELVTNSETVLAREQFESIAQKALKMSADITNRKWLGTISLASFASESYPGADEWPYINLKGFEVVTKNLIETSSGRSMGLMPIVMPDQVAPFEDHVYNTVFPSANYPNTTGVSSFGKGIYGVDHSLNNEDFRYHDTDGNTSWGSPYQLLAPYLFHSMGPAILSINLHSVQLFGSIIDDVITCSNEQAKTRADEDDGRDDYSCGMLSDILVLTGATRNVRSGPGAIIMIPIYSVTPRELVGFVSSTVVWEETMVNVFSNEVNGIDAVLQTDTQTFTYEIRDGVPILRNETDLHDPNYSEYGQTITLNTIGLFSNHSANYTLTLYPNAEFFEIYRTNNPLYVTMSCVAVMAATSLLFIVYDFCVRLSFKKNRVVSQHKRNFVRFVSHEIRTPLNVVSMGLQLLQEEMAPFCNGGPPTAKSHVNKEAATDLTKRITEWFELSSDILSSAHSSVSVVNDLLNYDKVQSRTMRLELEMLPAADQLIDDTTAEFQLQAKAKGIVLTHEVERQDQLRDTGMEPDDPEDQQTQLTAIGDSVRLALVLRNLISNSLKFTAPEGRVCVRTLFQRQADQKASLPIKLHTGESIQAPQSGTLVITVTDTGAGMAAQEVDTVFGDGVQFNVAQQGGNGSGLGLFIAKGIMEQHGGTLECSSEGHGKGTTFTAALPLYDVPVSDAAMTASSKQDDARSRGTGVSSSTIEALRILVVDDAAMNRKLLARLLENRGHKCDLAENGRVAVEKVRAAIGKKISYHVILMDNSMPEMDGPTAVRELRSHGCESLVVGITGSLFEEDVRHFKEGGVDKVLAKPVDLQALENILHECGVLSYRPSSSIESLDFDLQMPVFAGAKPPSV